MRSPAVIAEDISTFEALRRTCHALMRVRRQAEALAAPFEGKPDEHSVCVTLGDIRALAAMATSDEQQKHREEKRNG